jgi:hypothetical protein
VEKYIGLHYQRVTLCWRPLWRSENFVWNKSAELRSICLKCNAITWKQYQYGCNTTTITTTLPPPPPPPQLLRTHGKQYHYKYHNTTTRTVGIATGYVLDDRGSRVRLPAGAGNFSLHSRVQKGSGAHPASYLMGTRGSFPGSIAAGAWSWPLTI